MKSISETIKETKSYKLPINFGQLNLEKKLNSERASIIKEFVDKLNKERLGTKYKPLSPKVVAIRLAHLGNSDLYYFLKACESGKSFGQKFFGMLKVKKCG